MWIAFLSQTGSESTHIDHSLSIKNHFTAKLRVSLHDRMQGKADVCMVPRQHCLKVKDY
eukprot:c37217_g1_i1 orf=178-354(+)